MDNPLAFEPEKKLWLPKSADEPTDGKFREEMNNLMVRYRVGAAAVVYVNFNAPSRGKIMILGKPSKGWLDAAWQRLRLLASDMITRGMVK